MAKVLVVDDEPSLRDMLEDILSIAGYKVITACDGKDALLKVFLEKPDIVLLDCSMPEMDGYEVITHLRKEPKFMNLPIIMLTASEGESAEIKGFTSGTDDYMTKPFKAPILLARIKNMLERKKLSVDSNPLTSLAGNSSIRTEAEKRLNLGQHFALLYIDISNFKSYNDKYGFQNGDEVIKFTADCLLSCVKNEGLDNDFIGHIGGDDFIVITSLDTAENIASAFIREFDLGIPGFYTEIDKSNGYVISYDRQNNAKKFPLMSVSVAIISTKVSNITHFAEIAKRAAELKTLAKRNEKSSYVFERRK
ncbi:MAG: response regulator [Endomicrobium sp.]|jgi:diguanylate cyclase (GGDEF)-like protein|nr:response regulator [Endomicrobium sp.]